MTDAAREDRYTILDGPAIHCHTCDQVSHDINDVRQRYCGRCQCFHEGQHDPVMPAELRLIADSMVMEARATIARGREVPPEIIVLRLADKEYWQAEVNMGTPEERDIMAQEVRLLADEHKADAVLLLSEAWTLAASDESRAALHAQYGGSLANVPGRHEMLMLSVEAAGGQHWKGLAPISGSGLARRCGEMRYKWMSHDQSIGRFAHFLLSQAEQEQMAAVLAKIADAWRAEGIDPEAMMELGDGIEYRLIDLARRMMVKHRTFSFDIDESRLAFAAAIMAPMLKMKFA